MWLRHIEIRNCRHLRTVNIDLSPRLADRVDILDALPKERFRHLILTGPNGSGKSSLLCAIHAYVTLLNGSSVPEDTHCIAKGTWTGGIPTTDTPLVYSGLYSPQQMRVLEPPDGVRGFSPFQKLGPTESIGVHIEQLLVNRCVQQALEHMYGTSERTEVIRKWLDAFEASLRNLFQSPDLILKFDRDQMRFRINIGNGNLVTFQEMADGHRYLFSIFAELFSRTEILPFELRYNDQPPGVVLIDEPECHLHLELQSTIMPFLTATFPSIQFIVATHSPLVASSLQNSVILDLRDLMQVDGHDVNKKRFGELVTGLFGLDSEFSEVTKQKLQQLRILDGIDRNARQELEYVALLKELSESSHTLALALWVRYLAQRGPV